MSLDSGRNPEETNINTERTYKLQTERLLQQLGLQYCTYLIIVDMLLMWFLSFLINFFKVIIASGIYSFFLLLIFIGFFSQVNFVNVDEFLFFGM